MALLSSERELDIMEYKLVTPTAIKHLKELHILNTTESNELSCTMSATLYEPILNKLVTVTFEGVQELNITRLYAGAIVGPLKARDISERQLETIKYKVMDFEEDKISFLCKRFSAA